MLSNLLKLNQVRGIQLLHLPIHRRPQLSGLHPFIPVSQQVHHHICFLPPQKPFQLLLDYYNGVLYGVPSKALDRLQYVQSSAARVLTHVKPWQLMHPHLYPTPLAQSQVLHLIQHLPPHL